ncbi:MAG: hypothetical protein PVH19_01300 [Planctomycetia bacterium]
MNKTEWLRAQIVILILTVILVPLSAFEAAVNIATTLHALEGNEFPSSTQFFINIGPGGLLLLALIPIVAVGILSIKGRRAMTVVISMMIVIVSECFFLFAMLAAMLPFWRIIYRLSE